MKRIFLSMQKLWILSVMCLFATGLSAQNVSKYLKDCEINKDNHKYGIVFRGKQLVTPAYEEIIPLTDYVFRIKENGKYGLLNVGFMEEDNWGGGRSRLLAMEKIEGSRYYIYFYVSETCIYDRIELYDNRFLMAYKGDSKGLMDKYGNNLIPCKYNEITRKGDVCYVSRGNQQGIFNRYGKVIIPCQYVEILRKGDVYYVWDGNKYGVINKYGNKIVSPVYSNIEKKGESYWVYNGDKQGIINRFGNVIVPCRYSEILTEEGMYRVCLDSEYGIINKFGNVIIPCQYDEVAKIKDNYCVKKAGLYGIYNRYGNRLLSCTFDSINFLRDGKFLAVKDGKQQLYDKFGNLLSDYSEGSVYYSTSDGVRGIE